MAVRVWTGEVSGSYDTAGNWVDNVRPVNGDSVLIAANATDNIDGFDDSAVTLVGFKVEVGSSITIGDSTEGVITPLKITLLHSAAYYNAELGGTGETYLDITDYGDILVHAAGAAPSTGEYALNLSGTHNVATAGTGDIHIHVDSGTIGIGGILTEDMEVNRIFIAGSPDAVEIGNLVTTYDDAAAPTLDLHGGALETRCALGAVIKTGGTWHHLETGAVASISDVSGSTFYESTGTLTNLYVSEGGVFDGRGDLRAFTITNCELGSGGSIYDPHKIMIWTNGIDLVRCRLADVTLDLGKHITVSPSAI